MVGVYKITNLKNGKVYIGESLDIEERWLQHKQDLISDNHHSCKLQKDFNVLGKNYFKFEIVEKFDDNLKLIIQKCLLIVLEDKYIKEYDSINNGYNIENTLELILKGEKSIFDRNNINKKEKYIIKEIIKNIENNNGIYIPTNNAIKKSKEVIIKEKQTIKNKPKFKFNTNNIFTKDNIIYIIEKCKSYKFNEEYEGMSKILQANGFNIKNAYQILRDINIISSNIDIEGNKLLIDDLSMFKNQENILKNVNTKEIDKRYNSPYITKKGFKYILKKLLKYAYDNNINIFTKKFIQENLSI